MKTNIEAIKDFVETLLYVDISETEFSPVIVSHPIFESGIWYSKDKFLNLLESEDALNEARAIIKKRIANCKTAEQAMYVLRSPYYMTFMLYCKDCMSSEDFSRLLGTAWTSQENPNQDINVSVDEARELFLAADKKYLMDEEELEKYEALPETLLVFRGVAEGRNPDGMSWTNSKSKAEWFASRFGGNGYLLKKKIRKSDILAVFTRRDEDEIVVYGKGERL